MRLSLGIGLGITRRDLPTVSSLAPGLALDLDLSIGATITGGAVSALADLSGNGRHFEQTTVAKRPAHVAAGAASYMEVGAAHWLQGSGSASSWGWLHSAASYVVIVALVPAGTNKVTGLLTTCQGFINEGFLLTAYRSAGGAAGTEMYICNGSGTTRSSLLPATVTGGAVTALEYAWQPSSSPYARVLDRGVELGSATSLAGAVPNLTPQYAARLGRFSGTDTGDTLASTRIYRVLAWNRLPSIAERDRLRTYLAWRYGLAMSFGA